MARVFVPCDGCRRMLEIEYVDQAGSPDRLAPVPAACPHCGHDQRRGPGRKFNALMSFAHEPAVVTDGAAGELEEGVPLAPGRPTPARRWELTRADRKLLRSYGIATS